MRLLITLIVLLFTFNLFSIETIQLQKDNTVLVRGPIEEASVSKMISDILQISDKLPKDKTIYLVFDSPGGSVYDGIDAIQILKQIPQKVHSISIFAASMAFMISQYTEKRFITEKGIMMAHRAAGGFQGQFEVGEVESRLKLWKSIVIDMEEFVSKRMGLSLSDYKTKIVNELWMYGKSAVSEKAADDVVNITCSKDLIDMRIEKGGGADLFGFNKPQVFSGCPLIRGPIGEKKILNNVETVELY